jgi:hypothetical protein
VTGEGNALEGRFVLDVPVARSEQPALLRLLEAGYHCNNARVHGGEALGDPTEIALRVAAIKGGWSRRRPAAARGDALRLLGQVHGRAGGAMHGERTIIWSRARRRWCWIMCSTQLNAAGDDGAAGSRAALGPRRELCRRGPAHPGFARSRGRLTPDLVQEDLGTCASSACRA